jgi:glycosyltransferase involved in cell wall biosynthesis
MVLPALEEWPASPQIGPTGNPCFRLTYVGALQGRDAPELLFEAMRMLARQGVPLTLDVVGHYDGTARGERFRRLCGSDPLLSRAVRFVGSVEDSALRRRLAASDGLVLPRRPARTEALAFPTRLVEYLRYGRPVFVSDVGDVSRYLVDGHEAIFIHPTDPRWVAHALAGVALSPDRGVEIGRRGFRAGARAFDRRRHAGRLLEFAASLRRERAA